MKGAVFFIIGVLVLIGTTSYAHDRRCQPEQEPRYSRTCRQTRSSLGFEFYTAGPDIANSAHRKVFDGAELEVLGYEPVYYQGWSNGVKFRVIENGNDPSGAGPGEILWAYRALFNCQ